MSSLSQGCRNRKHDAQNDLRTFRDSCSEGSNGNTYPEKIIMQVITIKKLRRRKNCFFAFLNVLEIEFKSNHTVTS